MSSFDVLIFLQIVVARTEGPAERSSRHGAEKTGRNKREAREPKNGSNE